MAIKEGVMSTAPRVLTYLHGDHLGSSSLTTNASGQKVSEQPFGKLRAGCYKPYGEVRWSSGAGLPTDPSTDRITGPLRAGITFTLRLRSELALSEVEGASCGRVVTVPFLCPPGSICLTT